MFADTIIALASGRLPSGVAVVRISGPNTRFVVETISGDIPEPRAMALRQIRDGEGVTIDKGLVVFFPAPSSFTGDDCAEIHVHGGKAVVSALLNALVLVPGVRLADAGEFTKRAFLNGKMDLLQAEALADLISAETEAQRRLAAMNADGAQGALYSNWRKRLIHARAMIEAELDFADEQDVQESMAESVWADVGRLKREIEQHIAGFSRAEMVRDGFDVVIVGAPNAGKSSLLNALTKRDVAIVSDEPGTTRDLVETLLDLGGVKVRITDTAGLRDDPGAVEAQGIERARRRAGEADFVVLLVDATSVARPDLETGYKNSLVVGSKADLLNATPAHTYDLVVSAKTGAGIDDLLNRIGRDAQRMIGEAGDVLPSRLRHVLLLRDASASLKGVLASADDGLEIRAEGLRRAGEMIGRISGAVDVEDLLDVIFSQFCIGK